MRLDLWREPPQAQPHNGQLFRVGHLSAPLTTLRRGLTAKLDIDNHYQH
ncbi:hypothetical protein M5585_23035 [Serratia ureilytica]